MLTRKTQNNPKKDTELAGVTILLPAALLVVLLFFVLEKFFMQVNDGEDFTHITLCQGDIRISGAGAEADGDTVLIGQGGHYRIEGTLENGQIYVDSDDDEIVLLEFCGASISNPSEAAVFIEHAEHAAILLTEGTENQLESGRKDDKKGDRAVIYAEGDLEITGKGLLRVIGNLNHGIQSKADLWIESGYIEVKAVGNALKGKDSVTIEGGSFRIDAGGKGIQAKHELLISGGNLRITKAEEGLEANQVFIEGGTIEIAAEDDGINANGGEDKKKKNSSGDIVETMPNLIIRGGRLYIDAEGDGLDSNGNLLIEGGEIVIDGPTKDDDGPLDYGKENDGICRIKGGMVLAIGSSGMAETFDESSEQCSFRWLLDQPYEAGSEIVITDAGGSELYRHTAAKTGASVVFSCPQLKQGETYTLFVGEESVEIRQDRISAGK